MVGAGQRPRVESSVAPVQRMRPSPCAVISKYGVDAGSCRAVARAAASRHVTASSAQGSAP
eukprot:5435659-Lingulodinium_polyedra.AAC.1